MKFHLLAASLAALIASGCTTTLRAKELDLATKRFATSNTIPSESIKVKEPFDVDSAGACILEFTFRKVLR